VARKCSCGGANEQPVDRESLLQLQRQVGNRVARDVLAASRDGRVDREASVEESIQTARGGGQPLDHGVRSQMEGSLGSNFKGVRVHTDSRSDSLNKSLSARAFTTGQDIFFRSGAYNPGSSSGRELIAHELTHVVQQRGGDTEASPAMRQMLNRAPETQEDDEAMKAGRMADTSMISRQEENEDPNAG
jgi:hypothetical protein